MLPPPLQLPRVGKHLGNTQVAPTCSVTGMQSRNFSLSYRAPLTFRLAANAQRHGEHWPQRCPSPLHPQHLALALRAAGTLVPFPFSRMVPNSLDIPSSRILPLKYHKPLSHSQGKALSWGHSPAQQSSLPSSPFLPPSCTPQSSPAQMWTYLPLSSGGLLEGVFCWWVGMVMAAYCLPTPFDARLISLPRLCSLHLYGI